MSDKVNVNARKRFFLGGKNVGPGWIEVPAEKVEKLAGKGLIDSPAAAGQTTEAVLTSSDELPEDFPSRGLLAGSRFKTFGAIKSASDEELLEISGIGEAKLKQIRDALK